MTKQEPELKVPQIAEEEDTPFPDQCPISGKIQIDQNLANRENIDDKILWFKYKTGRNILYASMALMAICVIAELIMNHFGLKSDLMKNAFEAFKLIAMTAIGFILGTNVSK